LIQQRDEITIIDLGAGSGCLGLGIGLLLIERRCSLPITIHLVESSRDALQYLCKNAENVSRFLGRQNLKIEIHSVDWNQIQWSVRPTAVVSNPPYINEDEFKNLASSVKDFEPKAALVPPDCDAWAMNSYLEILGLCHDENFISKLKLMAFELSSLQADPIRAAIPQRLKNHFSKISIVKDMCDKERFLWMEC
jgi:release factor glutamine methyltransferase